jgi:septal ring factor EnvC (AmiA/AmiB activator)
MSSSQLNLHQSPVAAPEPENSKTSEKSKRELDSTDHDGDVQAEQAGKLHKTDAEFEKLEQEFAEEKNRTTELERQLHRLTLEKQKSEHELTVYALFLASNLTAMTQPDHDASFQQHVKILQRFSRITALLKALQENCNDSTIAEQQLDELNNELIMMVDESHNNEFLKYFLVIMRPNPINELMHLTSYQFVNPINELMHLTSHQQVNQPHLEVLNELAKIAEFLR